MRKIHARPTELQKKRTLGHGRTLVSTGQHQLAPVQPLTPQGAYRRAQVNQNSLTPADLLALQRTVGNRQVQRMVVRRTDHANGGQQSETSPENLKLKLKTKLAVDVPNASNEQGADRVVNQVVRTPEPGSKNSLGTQPTRSFSTQIARKAIMRKVDEMSVEAEFNQWADSNKKDKSKTSKDFPWNVWDFVRPQIVDTAMAPLPKPKDKAGIEKWNDNFSKAEIIGNWLGKLKSTTTDDSIKTDAANKIYFIADALAKAGFVSKSMAQAANTDDQQKALVYSTILNNPSSASAAELETIFNFQTKGVSDPKDVPFIASLTNVGAHGLKALDAAKTQTMFKVMNDKYKNHATVIEAMANTLIYNTKVRTTLADDMMSSKTGTPEILFQILSHPYFKDPDYPGAKLLNVPKGMSADDATKKHWKEDMPFAVKYKQQYYVKFLIKLAADNKIVIPPPANFTSATLRTWLDTHTEKIGEAAAKAYPTNNDAVFDIYKNITDIFFYHIDHDKNAIPDEQGKLNKLGVQGKPDKMRIEADCDVFATYAMRLYNSAGFEPIGYLGLYPTGADASRAAHAAALIRKNNAYFIINNKGMFASSCVDTKPNDQKAAAIKDMKTTAINDAYEAPAPTNWEIYYADAEAKGKLPSDFLAKPTKYRRTDLE